MVRKDNVQSYPNPLMKANCISKFFFWWLKDIIWCSRRQELTHKNVYDTIPEDLSEPLACRLETAWIKEVNGAHKKKKNPSLWNVIAKVYYWDFIKLAVVPICFTAAQITIPEILKLIMSYFQSPPRITVESVYLYGSILLALILFRAAAVRHGFFYFNRLGMHVKIACSSLIYKKMIRVPNSSDQKMDSSVISLLTIDVGKFERFFITAPYLVTVPLQLLIQSYFIWCCVDLTTTLECVAPIVLLNFPIHALYSKVALKFRVEQGESTDVRVSAISEIIEGIKAIKMYVWENYLEKLVYTTRRLEIRVYAKILYLESVVLALSSNSYRLGTFIVTTFFILRYSEIAAVTILPVTLHLVNLQRSIVSMFLPSLISMTDMRVSLKRIENFLLLEDLIPHVDDIKNMCTEAVSMKQVTACWDEKSVIFQNLSVNFTPKKLYAIIGSVGSGKSSLLKLILKELKVVSGKVSVDGTVSYAAQDPWLFNGSVRDNILFGEKYNQRRYEEVVNVCALIEDFIHLPYGDQTLVGDRGSNLSGGQCALINLARAVYRNSDIYLFDNPLSSVDAYVAKKIMSDCINGLLKYKTRILVTHNIQCLSGKTKIIFLEKGKIKFKGCLDDFQRNDQYSSQLTFYQTEESTDDVVKIQSSQHVIVPSKLSAQNEKKLNEETDELLNKNPTKKTTYLNYVKAGNLKFVYLIILTNILYTITASAYDLGLGEWTKNDKNLLKKQTVTESNLYTDKSFDTNYLTTTTMLIKFGVLLTLVILSTILKNFLFYKFALEASETIHNRIFSRILTTTPQFFEANSVGKILNRFSEDTYVIDNVLPQALTKILIEFSYVVAQILPAIVVSWWIFFPFIMSMYISILIGKMFTQTIQRIKKLAASANSPILSFASSSLTGATTIRVFRADDMVTKDYHSLQDKQTAAQFLSITIIQACTFWLEISNLGLLASTTYLCIFLKSDKTFEGHVGLTLMQLLNISICIPFCALNVAETLAYMTSVERMMQFMDLKQEAVIEDESNLLLPSSWPDKGEIVFEHLYLRYSDDDNPVLRDVNCVIQAKSKVGIVGRTGAGKSSLISALFRFAKTDGYVSIDGVNNKSVDLRKLRSKISIIPQQQFLFKGTLRKNLDITEKFDDSSLWFALESVELKRSFNSLDFPIERGGSNLSAGQRQLLSLARAILVKNKILILDEVTADVDPATDALIQKSVKNQFQDCTVLRIAHRLDTVMDCDKILVMEDGRVVEYDNPYVLLQNNNSYLFKTVEKTDNATKRKLNAIAKEAYQKQETLNTSSNK